MAPLKLNSSGRAFGLSKPCATSRPRRQRARSGSTSRLDGQKEKKKLKTVGSETPRRGPPPGSPGMTMGSTPSPTSSLLPLIEMDNIAKRRNSDHGKTRDPDLPPSWAITITKKMTNTITNHAAPKTQTKTHLDTEHFSPSPMFDSPESQPGHRSPTPTRPQLQLRPRPRQPGASYTTCASLQPG